MNATPPRGSEPAAASPGGDAGADLGVGAWGGVAEAARPHFERLDDEDRVRLRQLLWWDMSSEYDARFLSAYVEERGLELSQAFRSMHAAWAREEELHYAVVRRVREALFGWSEQERADFAARRADFAPLAHLFADEFSITVLIAYDELCTVRGYQANLPLYDRLGPEFGAFLRRVIADEALHYKRALDVIAAEHRHRLPELPALLERIRAAEDLPYGNTFVMDHQDDIYTEAVSDRAVKVLLAQAAKLCG